VASAKPIKRKADKVFGLIEFFAGRLFYQGIEGRFNSQSYQEFITGVLEQTEQPLFLISFSSKTAPGITPVPPHGSSLRLTSRA